jgi:hypothetical protein
MRFLDLSLGVALCLGSPCAAQSPWPALGLSPRLAAAVESSKPLALSGVPPSIRPTYWKEGAVIGGILGGALGVLAGGGLCGQSEEPNKHCAGSMILGGMVGALLLGIPGALVGGLFPKRSQ